MTQRKSLFQRLVYSNDLTKKETAICFLIFMLPIIGMFVVIGLICYFLYG